VFVDTSALLALIWAKDRHHSEAAAAWTELRRQGARLTTTDWVIAETVTLTRARASFDLSLTVAERLLSPPFEVEWVDRNLADEALALYRKYRDHALSLCDCASFAVMRRRRLAAAFAYDDDFRHVGFRTL
jgi:predicted nucleic acid-binding protein